MCARLCVNTISLNMVQQLYPSLIRKLLPTLPPLSVGFCVHMSICLLAVVFAHACMNENTKIYTRTNSFLFTRYTDRLDKGLPEPVHLLRLANEYNMTDLLAHCEGLFFLVLYLVVYSYLCMPIYEYDVCRLLLTFWFPSIELMVSRLNQETGFVFISLLYKYLNTQAQRK